MTAWSHQTQSVILTSSWSLKNCLTLTKRAKTLIPGLGASGIYHRGRAPVLVLMGSEGPS